MHRRGVADIARDEAKVRVRLYAQQVVQIAGVGEAIEDDDRAALILQILAEIESR